MKKIGSLTLIVFLIFNAVFSQTPATCLDKNEWDTELLGKAFSMVATNRLDKTGRYALLKLYKYGVDEKLATNLAPQMLKNIPAILNLMEASEALNAQDYKKLSYLISKEALALKSGIPYFGPLVTTLEIAHSSYKELRHQDCLLQIDLAYYDFLEDTALPTANTKNRIDYYIKYYIRGEGLDPLNRPREVNRKYLQCYIDEEFPPEQRIQIDGSELDPFERVAQAMAWNHPRLRTATQMMLSDFDKRKDLEEERKKAIKWVRSEKYQILKQTLPYLSSYPYVADWVCEVYRSLQPSEATVFSGLWGSDFGEMKFAQTGNEVSGTFDHKNGKFKGNIIGNLIKGSWTQDDPTPGRGGGSFEFTFDPTRSSWSGKWNYQSDDKGYWRPNKWDGWRKEE